MRVTLQYFDGCPSWRVAEQRLRQALVESGHPDVEIDYQTVETPQEAERLGFTGSPTVLIDGRDPFAVPGAAAGLACRVYRTPDGLAGSPTLGQLTEALRQPA